MVKKLIFIAALVIAISWAVPEPAVEGQIGYQVTATSVAQTAYPLLGPAGTASAPTFGWTADSDGSGTGLYRGSANRVGVSTNGTLKFEVSTTSVTSYLPTIISETLAGNTSAEFLTITGVLGIMNGSDTVRGLFIDLTNADHEGTSNLVYGLDIDTITGDAQASEYAIRLGDGWDKAIVFENDALMELGTAGGEYQFRANGGLTSLNIRERTGVKSMQALDLVWLTPAMDGSDTSSGFIVDITNGAHAGVTNILYGINIDDITGDAQARETGINIETGWDVGISSTSHIFQRENFQQGFRKQLASDFSAATDGDGDVNIVLGTNGVNFEYREELAKGTSSFILNNAGAIDISADNTTNDEGVEFMLGSSQTTTSGYLVAQTDQLCFSVNLKVTLIAGTDQFVIGWRANEAYDAANVYTNYSDYNVVGINNVDGSVFGLSDSTTGAAETDDSGTNWADGETKTLKACIDGAGLPHGYLDGTLITETNRTTAMDAGINMVPFVSYLQAGGAADAAILINWWEITAN